jgi:hypothetical protein
MVILLFYKSPNKRRVDELIILRNKKFESQIQLVSFLEFLFLPSISGGLKFESGSITAAVVWRFAGDGYIMRVALDQPGICNSGQAGIGSQLSKVFHTGISHPGPQPTD